MDVKIQQKTKKLNIKVTLQMHDIFMILIS